MVNFFFLLLSSFYTIIIRYGGNMGWEYLHGCYITLGIIFRCIGIIIYLHLISILYLQSVMVLYLKDKINNNIWKLVKVYLLDPL